MLSESISHQNTLWCIYTQCLQSILTALHSTQKLNQEPMLHKPIGSEKELAKWKTNQYSKWDNLQRLHKEMLSIHVLSFLFFCLFVRPSACHAVFLFFMLFLFQECYLITELPYSLRKGDLKLRKTVEKPNCVTNCGNSISSSISSSFSFLVVFLAVIMSSSVSSNISSCISSI